MSDTGRGIRPEFLPYVFDRFRQADASASRQMGGLGLAIVRHIVEAHGGAVTAESEGEGRGATFTVTPADRPAGTRPHAASSSGVLCPPVITGLNVLVVDDDPDTLDYVAAVLEHCGAVVRRASTAAEAFAAFKQEAPDVLVSDIGLPGQDGYELMRKVRKLPRKRGGHAPAAALTAYARDGGGGRAGGGRVPPLQSGELVEAHAAVGRLHRLPLGAHPRRRHADGLAL